MYKIYKENELIWTNGTPETGLYSAKISLGVNGANTFEASVASGLELFKDLPVLNKRIFIFQDNEKDPIFEGRLLKRVTDFYGNTTYSFEGALGYLNDSIQPPVDYTGQTIETIFNGLLTEHNKQVEDWKQLLPGRITVEDHTESDTYSGKGRLDDTNTDREVYTADSDTTGINQANLTTGYETTWDAINNLLINNLAGYLVIRYEGDKKYLDYLKEYMPSEGQVILFGSNLLDYSSTLDYSSLCTGVLPLGYSKGADSGDGNDDDRDVYTQESNSLSNIKNKLTIESVNGGSKILWNQDAVNNYGRIVKSVEWSDCKDASKLLDKARKYLTNTQFDNLSLECKIIDLHFVDNTEGPLHCMHLVRVKSEPHGLDKMMPISSMEIDLMNPANDIITIGQTYNSITGQMAENQTNISASRNDISNVQATVDNNAEVSNETNNYFSTSINKTNEQITLEAEKRENDTVTLRSEISIKADEIKSECNSYTDGKHSEIVQTADKISSRVSDTEGRCSSIEQTVDSITNRVGNCETQLSDHGLKITNAQQTADAAKAAAQSAANTASNANSQYDTLKSQLSSGTTTINGACIETGSIDSTKIKAIDISKVLEDGVYRVVSEKSFNDSGSEKLKACVASMLTNETAAKRAMANYVQNRLEQFKRDHPKVNW